MVRMSRGMRKYSTVLARANEFGGMMQTSALMSTKDLGSKFFGSTTVLKTFVNTLNSSPTRTSYPYDDTPNETTPERVWLSTNGSIIRCSSALRLIHFSVLIATRRSSSGPADAGHYVMSRRRCDLCGFRVSSSSVNGRV